MSKIRQLKFTFSTPTVAAILGVGERYVRRLIESKRLKATRGTERNYNRDAWFVTFGDLQKFLRRYGSESSRARASEYLRVGQLEYTAAEAQGILGIGPRQMVRLLAAKSLKASKVFGRRRLVISRAELDRYIATKKNFPRRDEARRALRPPSARLIVCSHERSMSLSLSDFDPLHVTSMYALGYAARDNPLWGVLIDWSRIGRPDAHDAAERLKKLPDRPILIALTSADEMPKPLRFGLWDLILTRPITGHNLAASVSEMFRIAGPAAG